MACSLSFIIPTLNEASVIKECLGRLQDLRGRGHEAIVVDGRSTDHTLRLATPLADHAFTASTGRASQMNAGAACATGKLLVFLHADTWLPERVEEILCAAHRNQTEIWGYFNVRLSGTQKLLRIIEFSMNLRSRITGIATGDQVIFVAPALFQRVGGFPNIPLMEDIAMSQELKRVCPPTCLRAPVTTSSRRWEECGILRTVLLMWCLRLAYALGIDPLWLARRYYQRPLS